MVRNNNKYYLIIIISVFNISSLFVAVSWNSVLVICLILFSTYFIYNCKKINYNGYLVLPIIIGSLGIHKLNIDAARDALYATMPVFTFFFGMLIQNKKIDIKYINNIIIYNTGMLAIFLIIKLYLVGEVSYNLLELNSEKVLIGEILPFSLAIMLINNPKFFKVKYYYLNILLNLIAMLLSLSRIFWVLFFTYIIFLGKKINLYKILIYIIVASIAIAIITIVTSDNDYNIGFKILNSINEISFKKYDSYEDISINWRGYESYLALQHFDAAVLSEKIFGRGYGALIPLEFTINLAGSDYDAIPVLHNGYLYVLTKTGLIGLAIYIIFLYKLLIYGFRAMSSNNININLHGKLLFSLILSCILEMYVAGGIAEGGNIMILFLSGFCYSYLLNNDKIKS